MPDRLLADPRRAAYIIIAQGVVLLFLFAYIVIRVPDLGSRVKQQEQITALAQQQRATAARLERQQAAAAAKAKKLRDAADCSNRIAGVKFGNQILGAIRKGYLDLADEAQRQSVKDTLRDDAAALPTIPPPKCSTGKKPAATKPEGQP